MTPIAEPAGRSLRRDAARNRQRILRAAAEVFRERGLDATLDDVAHRAGVGVGTVYRRFSDKETLVAELFQAQIDDLVSAAEKACEADDPWGGFLAYFDYVATTMAGDLGLRQMLLFATYGRDQVACLREQVRPAVDRLVTRAQQAGALRPDFSATDVPMLTAMLASVAEYAAPVQPGLWRRYLTLILDSLRPDGATPLPCPALTPAEMELTVRAHSSREATRR
jgi:AcrR family transcriptional regulator